jgi:hypothetical protein
MASELKVRVGEFVSDIRSKLTDYELMEKYGLEAVELKKAIKKLVDSQIIPVSEVYHRRILYDSSLDSEPRRRLPRHYLALLLPIFESNAPSVRGWLTDISEEGIGLKGIRSDFGEIRLFSIAPGRFSDASEILFEAECRWSEWADEESECSAGFMITKITDPNLLALRDFIRVLSIEN